MPSPTTARHTGHTPPAAASSGRPATRPAAPRSRARCRSRGGNVRFVLRSVRRCSCALLLKPLSLRERGGGEGPVFDGAQDRLENGIRMTQDIIVPESHDLEALRLQEARSRCILLVTMLRAVQLNGDSRFQTHVRRHEMLAPELESIQLAGAQSLTQLVFRIRDR